MKIQFLGVGSAFTTPAYYQSNMLMTADSGKKLLIDCGSDIRFAFQDRPQPIQPDEIDAVYISHLHSDHAGGLEWLSMVTYFNPHCKRPTLFMERRQMHRLWNTSLKGGLRCIAGKNMHLTDYFHCCALPEAGSFTWEGIRCTLLKMPHILTGYDGHYSFGLFIRPNAHQETGILLTTDTLFQPALLTEMADKSTMIFHDCETSQYKTGVHTHYDELCTLPETIRPKMWLYHYQPHPSQNPREDGFQGFVVKGQEFDFEALPTPRILQNNS
jgi:ribonuclease BN (tRNA processing enzyme)